MESLSAMFDPRSVALIGATEAYLVVRRRITTTKVTKTGAKGNLAYWTFDEALTWC